MIMTEQLTVRNPPQAVGLETVRLGRFSAALAEKTTT
jgi:hypothetical protein